MWITDTLEWNLDRQWALYASVAVLRIYSYPSVRHVVRGAYRSGRRSSLWVRSYLLFGPLTSHFYKPAARYIRIAPVRSERCQTKHTCIWPCMGRSVRDVSFLHTWSSVLVPCSYTQKPDVGAQKWFACSRALVLCCCRLCLIRSAIKCHCQIFCPSPALLKDKIILISAYSCV